MSFIQNPFEHIVIDNFLEENDFKEVENIYKSQQFKLLSTDLFRFLQTNEINLLLENFLSKLDRAVFYEFKKEKDTYYTCFASFYREGDFLLCHDDCIDFREYAFTFYLDDFDSGELVLYDNDCLTEAKRIEVRKNRIVVFKVGKSSFHEVKKCIKDGRRSITGWLNCKERTFNTKEEKRKLPGLNSNLEFLEVADIKPFLSGNEKLMEISLDQFNDLFEHKGETLKGPLVDRKTFLIDMSVNYAFKFNGLELIYYELVHVTDDCYILGNDIVNEVENVIDGFYFFDDCKNLIKYTEDSNIVLSLDATKETLVLFKRNKESLYIENNEKNASFIHMIYKEI